MGWIECIDCVGAQWEMSEHRWMAIMRGKEKETAVYNTHPVLA